MAHFYILCSGGGEDQMLLAAGDYAHRCLQDA